MNDDVQLNGPSLDPASGNTPQQLVILCHGYGSDGQDLISLAPYFAKVLPDAFFIAPNAPEPCGLAPTGYQWFPLDEATEEMRLSGTQKASPILNAFIDQQLQKLGLDDSQLALVGFSQGTMVALHTSLRREKQMAGVIGYSGALIGEKLLMSEVVSRPPMLLIHGSMDNVVPPDALDHAVKALAMAGVTVTSEMRPGLEHSLDDRGVMIGMDFLAHVFGVPLPKPRPSQQDNSPPNFT